MRICVYGAASPTIDTKYIELVEKNRTGNGKPWRGKQMGKVIINPFS